MSDNKVKVVVTGFGPFSGHDVNASWETAKALNNLNLDSHGIDLLTKEIPVSYDTVVKDIPLLWNEHKPDLVVHLGVSSIATELTLEKLAHRSGYCKLDVKGSTPVAGCCYGEDDCITPEIDIEKICKEINEKNKGVRACVSTDAGRYLCEFTFYASLCINRSRVVFIHVPPIDNPYSTEQMAICVKNIILLLVDQIKSFPVCKEKKE